MCLLDVSATTDAGRSTAGHSIEHSRSIDIGDATNADFDANGDKSATNNFATSNDNTAKYAHSFASWQYGDTAASAS